MSSGERIRVGVVGAGEIVARSHLPVLVNLPDVEIAWIYDRDEARAAAVARAYHIPLATLASGPADLPAADVVLLGIPYGARWSYYEALAGRETALVIEKPLFRTVARQERLCAAWPDHALGHGFQRRSLGVVALCRELVASGAFGPLRNAYFGLGSPGAVTHGRYYATPELSGGGVLFEVGVHGIDALVYLVRATAIRLKRAQMVAESGMDLHTEAELELDTEGGPPIACTFEVSCLRETRQRIELGFDRARLRFSLFDTAGRLWLATGDGAREVEITPADARGYARSPAQTLYAHWMTFLRGLREGRANHTAARSALLTTAIVEQCYAAAGLHGEPGAP
jgi:predicted dehydrogenase